MRTAQIIGQRIRNYRVQKKLSQEELAELAGCHYTYIGQVERGEKNATIESVDRIEPLWESLCLDYNIKCKKVEKNSNSSTNPVKW